MREAFGTAVAIIVVVFGLFLIPMQDNANREDSITQDYVYAEVADFVQQVQLNGYISQDAYNTFTKKLSNTNVLYDIEMVHTHNVIIPQFNETGDAVTGTKSVSSAVYEDDILDDLYDKDGIYYMEVGDQFSVTVKNKSRTTGQKMGTLLTKSSTKYAIIATYGATIRNENY